VRAGWQTTPERATITFRLAWAVLVIPAFWSALSISSASPVRAGDYKVAYALDIKGRKISGVLDECNFGKVCRKNIDELALGIGVIAENAGDRRVFVAIDGSGGCCFFSDGVDSMRIDSTERLNQLPVFEGIRRSGNEFVRNQRIGTLYISIAY
jgi:hypothetical protein